MTDALVMRRKELFPSGVRETRVLPFREVELRSINDGAELKFQGYACVTEVGFEMYDMFGSFTEIVRQGAFKTTLSQNPDVAFLVNHEGTTLARTKSGTLRLSEDETGLNTEATFDPASPAVQVIRSAMERGDMDEMSFAFRVTRQEWSPDYEQRDILEVNLDKGDVSLVNYGANPFTSGGLRSLAELRKLGPIDRGTFLRRIGAKPYLAAVQELREGKTLSADSMATLQTVLDLVSGADDNIDEALATLSDFMGVPNPDEPPVDEPDANEQKSFPTGLAYALQRARVLQRLSA